MDFISWLKSFPGKDGKPTGRIMPGLLAYIIVTALCMIPIVLLLK